MRKVKLKFKSNEVTEGSPKMTSHILYYLRILYHITRWGRTLAYMLLMNGTNFAIDPTYGQSFLEEETIFGNILLTWELTSAGPTGLYNGPTGIHIKKHRDQT